MDVGPHQVIQFVQDAVDDLDQKVTLLVLQGRGHQEGQDLIEQRPRPKLARLVCDLSEGSLWKKVCSLKLLNKNLNDNSVAANEYVEKYL